MTDSPKDRGTFESLPTEMIDRALAAGGLVDATEFAAGEFRIQQSIDDEDYFFTVDVQQRIGTDAKLEVQYRRTGDVVHGLRSVVLKASVNGVVGPLVRWCDGRCRHTGAVDDAAWHLHAYDVDGDAPMLRKEQLIDSSTEADGLLDAVQRVCDAGDIRVFRQPDRVWRSDEEEPPVSDPDGTVSNGDDQEGGDHNGE